MAISLTLNIDAMASALDKASVKTLEAKGVQDGLMFEFITQDDDRVRPSHAALHGTVWRADDPNAPAPPLDFGCRCRVSYLAKTDTPAAEVLPETTEEPAPAAEHYSDWLDDNVAGWEKALASAKGKPPADWPSAIVVALGKLHPDATLTELRQWADLVIKARMRPIGGAP